MNYALENFIDVLEEELKTTDVRKIRKRLTQAIGFAVTINDKYVLRVMKNDKYVSFVKDNIDLDVLKIIKDKENLL